MLYDSDQNNARMRMKCITFRSMNPMYGRERKFSGSTLNYNAKFPFKFQQSLIKWQFSIESFSNTATISIIWFSMFSKNKNKFFERKNFCSLSKKDPHYANESIENQINEQKNNPIHSFNESKNKEKTNLVLEIDRKGEKWNKRKWPQKNIKSHKENGNLPNGVANFVIG